MREKILKFLNLSYGYGSGCGSGDGSGCGSGDGSGCGDGCGDGFGDGSGFGFGDGSGSGSGDGSGFGFGDGSGSGSGDGSGCGYGCGYGLKSINGERIWKVDDVQTIIREVHGNVAKGCIVESDWSFHPCYIVKQDNRFAHGETLHEAYESLQSKLFEGLSKKERVEKFKETYPDFDVQIPAKELFEWHNRLTGSCLMGRKSFARDHGIDVENDSFTVNEFVELTKDAYGSNVIKMILK